MVDAEEVSYGDSRDSLDVDVGGGSASCRWRYVRWLLLVYAAFAVLIDAKLFRPEMVFDGKDNVQIAEARAWLAGRLDLNERLWDTAEVNGKFYSPFPPLFTVIAAGPVALFGGVPHWLVLALLLVLPAMSFHLGRKLSGSDVWGAVAAIGLLCGSSLLPVASQVLRGLSQYYTNHALAVAAVLLFLLEYYGKRRVWVAGLALALAVFSRQLTIAFALPLLAMAWDAQPGHRPRRVAGALACLSFIVGVLLLLNFGKFGDPLDNGYARIYEGRNDVFAQDAKEYGLFSSHFVPRNLYYANVGLWRMQTIELAGESQTYIRPNMMGSGIWWTTPLLLWLVVAFRGVWRDQRARWLFASCVVVHAALLFYHATGADQRGFNRFSLDYLPVLVAIVVPVAFAGGRRWISLAMVAWSVLYFRVLIALPHIQVW